MATLTDLLFEVVDAQQTGATFKIVSNEPWMPIERKMIEQEDDPYQIVCGNPLDGAIYLVTSCLLSLRPDLLFEHNPYKGETSRMYGFLITKEG